jgi:hypothetical protein
MIVVRMHINMHFVYASAKEIAEDQMTGVAGPGASKR